MVNKCHAKRDTKTCSGAAGFLILDVPLASQLAFVLSIHHCLPSPSLPGPYYYYWPGNPVIKPFGVAELLCFDAAPFDARMTARLWCLLLTANV
ncbi:hypothetical protein [Candidatus Spongiihabitans sp.]|uniref:hypothetical protein n=1 Tax=Candidatus Spongiihabitans sp. TaxID=3101308 RepID=UPI003C797A52